MKTIITSIFLLFCIFTTVNAQNYTQKGTTFIENTSNSTSKRGKSIETKYTWQDKEGKSHKIYLSKNGRAFVKVTSKKTGNKYNKYLDERKFRQFKIEDGNIVWGKNWDLIFPIEQLHRGRIE